MYSISAYANASVRILGLDFAHLLLRAAVRQDMMAAQAVLHRLPPLFTSITLGCIPRAEFMSGLGFHRYHTESTSPCALTHGEDIRAAE